VARGVSGRVDADTPPLMGAEDFSFMLNERGPAPISSGIGNGDTQCDGPPSGLQFRR
jgi:hypothetical protein